mgnify:CR=1 FL=1
MPTKVQQGFTLIELIMVIVILGILSAFALPKFANFSTDARKSSLQGLLGAIKTTSKIVHLSCMTSAPCASAAYGAVVFVPAYKQNVRIVGGYADGGTIGRKDEIDDLLDHSGFDLSAPSGTTVQWAIPGTADCYVQYIQPPKGGVPAITVVDTGC